MLSIFWKLHNLKHLVTISFLATSVFAVLNATIYGQACPVQRRLYASVNKSTGAIDTLTLDEQDLLSVAQLLLHQPQEVHLPTANMALDLTSTATAFRQELYPGLHCPQIQAFQGGGFYRHRLWRRCHERDIFTYGTDAGAILVPREGETGLHTFSRLEYYNKTKPFLRNLQEFRTLFALIQHCGLIFPQMPKYLPLCLQPMPQLMRSLFRMQPGIWATPQMIHTSKQRQTISQNTPSRIHGEIMTFIGCSQMGQQANQSSPCAVRSAVICYNIANKFTFDPEYVVEGVNEFVLSLPLNATDYESAVLSLTTYVQYDALRLEIE